MSDDLTHQWFGVGPDQPGIPDDVMWGDLKQAVVISPGSEIAQQLVSRLSADGWTPHLLRRDEEVPRYQKWDLALVATGKLMPIERFEFCDYNDWRHSIEINALWPLERVHRLLTSARHGALVVFFAGPNPNLPQPNYSAYDAAKMLLIRMAETLNEESTYVRFVAIGPGFFRTKIHAPHDVSHRVERVTYDELYALLKLCIVASRENLGRNIHVHDNWRDLAFWNKDDGKLRREMRDMSAQNKALLARRPSEWGNYSGPGGSWSGMINPFPENEGT